jgi:hypothetical protein
MALCSSAVYTGATQYADGLPLFAYQIYKVCEAAYEYHPRRPEESILYQVVAENIESFLARQKERDRIVPLFVENDLRSFLDCGILERGFVRVHCDTCGKDLAVAYSCKSRSFCPSCGGRRMAETAAHLVDHVFPEVPVRQWVLSVPFPLRYRLAYDSSLVRDVAQIFVRTIFSSIRRRACVSASNRKARCGAVGFIQRFSDALNLDPHFHIMALDGIYIENSKNERTFLRVGPPSDAEVARVAERVHRLVTRLIEQRGLGQHADSDEADALRRDDPLLAELYGASITGRVATGPRAGKRIVRIGDEIDCEDAATKSGHCCASIEGFSVHGGVCSPARDRIRLERLLRYAARPPLSTERLFRLADGRLLYKLKRRWRDGTTHVIYEPMELMERLAALVPPPRFNVVRYYGVLAPAATLRPCIVPEDKTTIAPTNLSCPARIDTSKTDSVLAPASTIRPLIVPEDKTTIAPTHSGCPAKTGTTKTDSANTNEKRGMQPRNYSWAQLMMRVFEVDVLSCSRCGGRMRVLCAINSPPAIQKILACLGLPTRAPPIAPAKLEVDETLF